MSEIEKQNILLVDDKPENLLALGSILENLNVNLFKTTSGIEALSLLLKNDFAIVLLDVQMPEIDGFTTAELMRSSEKTKYTPIVFVTAISKDQKYIFKGYETGAVDYLFKPLDPYILKSKVKVFLELHKQKNTIQKQVNEIKVLRGILPICANCKKIRDDKGYWEILETYIQNHSEVNFSHSICSECTVEFYPDYKKIETNERN